MGTSTDDRSVVGAHDRVHGIDGQRIVDASTMPASVRHTNLTCLRFAERIAS
jgi:choline dehydrogenase-like flavoprotein